MSAGRLVAIGIALAVLGFAYGGNTDLADGLMVADRLAEIPHILIARY